MVSHDINEVVFMASRILVMTAHPGRIKTVLENPLPYPRDPRAPAYQAFVDKLHAIITGFYLPETEKEPGAPPVTVVTALQSAQVMTPIPAVEMREVIGLLEAVMARGGDVEFFRLTAEMGRAFTRILLAVKLAELLGFLVTPQDHLVLTELGKQFVSAPRKARRQLFRKQLVQVPLVKRLREMLERSPEQRLTKDILLEELAIQCPQEDPKRLLRILINLGRFADLWAYQPASGTLAVNGTSASAAKESAKNASPKLPPASEPPNV